MICHKSVVTSDSEHAYVLNCYINEDAKHDKSSGIAGAGYNVVYLTEMGKLFDNCHHMFTDNLFTTYAAANYLLEQDTFMIETMGRNQVQHIPNEIVSALTFCGIWCSAQEKGWQNNSSNSRYVQSKYGVVDSSDQVMYSYTYDHKSKSWSKKIVFNFLSRLLMNSYILYKQTIKNPKSRLEFIKDVTGFLASESKAILGDPVQLSSATKKLTQLPCRKESKCVVCWDWKSNAHRRSRTVCSSCQKGVHALCFQRACD